MTVAELLGREFRNELQQADSWCHGPHPLLNDSCCSLKVASFKQSTSTDRKSVPCPLDVGKQLSI